MKVKKRRQTLDRGPIAGISEDAENVFHRKPSANAVDRGSS
ncbi:MAG TPA: hypothetical protein VK536_02245 [Candidatus Limnocylindrales bacterium]|nr:hypothetical protein [Candidatus Limnocylindrales bacterium]